MIGSESIFAFNKFGENVFSQTVEYALRTVLYIATKSPDPQTTGNIAKATHVPAAYLSKVIQALNREDILRSKRGVGGGVTLVKTADELTILEVVNAVDPIKRIHSCPLELKAHGTHLCPLHRRVDNALESVEIAFKETTLAEVLAEPSSSIPLCDFPFLDKDKV